MKKDPQLLFFIISVIAYFSASYSYSQFYSIFILFLYLGQWFVFYKQNKKDLYLFCFTNAYCFSFLICNFIYPVFVHPYYPLGFIVHNFDENYISKGISLAQLGISSFFLGQHYYLSKRKTIQFFTSKKADRIQIHRNDIFDLFSLIFLLGYGLFIIGVSSLNYQLYNSLLDNFLTVISFIQIFFIISLISRASKNPINDEFLTIDFLKSNKLFFISLLLCVVGLAKIGDRGPIIQFGLITLTVYILFIKDLKLRHILLLLIFGISSMVFIRNNRIEGQHQLAMERREVKYNAQLPLILDVTTDLMANARCMYFGMEITDKKGYLWGRSFIKPLFSPFPYVPTFFSSLLFDAKPSDLSTGMIITEETKRLLNRREMEGVGTNNIVDIYMNFGVIGVIVLMSFFGYLVGCISVRKSYSFYFLFFYCVLMSLSVYMPRSTTFEFIRPMLWGGIILYFRNKYPNVLKRS